MSLSEQSEGATTPTTTPLITPSAEVIQTVNTLMKSGFELSDDQLVPDAKLKEDLGLDSLDAVDMLVYIEEKMGIRIEGERLRSVRTINDVYVLATEAALNQPA